MAHLSLRVASPDLRDVSQIRTSGKISMGESDLPLEKEYERLRAMREALFPYGKVLRESAESPVVNHLLGLRATPSLEEPPAAAAQPLVFINPKVAAVCQLMLRLAEVPLRNVVYSRNPRSSEPQKSTVMMAARTTKAIGEDASAFQTHRKSLKIVFIV